MEWKTIPINVECAWCGKSSRTRIKVPEKLKKSSLYLVIKYCCEDCRKVVMGEV